jgi:hypothetical protein
MRDRENNTIVNMEVNSKDFDPASALLEIGSKLPHERVMQIRMDETILCDNGQLTIDNITKVLEEPHYKVTKVEKDQYIEAYSTHVWDHYLNCAISCQGKRKLNINLDKDYAFIGIREDADTRCVYNGYLETLTDLRRIDRETKILPKRPCPKN